MTINILEYGKDKQQAMQKIVDCLGFSRKKFNSIKSCPFQINVDDAEKAEVLKDSLVELGCKILGCTKTSDEINYEKVPTKTLSFMAEECDGSACLELSKRYAHGTTLLQRDKERSKELRRLGMLYLYGTTVSPEFDEEKKQEDYKSVFFDENGKPYVDWPIKSQQMKKLLGNLGILNEKFKTITDANDITHSKLFNLVRPTEVKKAPKFFTKTFTILFLLCVLITIALPHFITITLLLPAYRFDKIRKCKKEYAKYVEDFQKYKDEKSKLTIENVKEEREVALALANLQDTLYDGLNVGLGIPFNKDLINRETYLVLSQELRKLFNLNDKAMLENDPEDKKVACKKYYDAKLCFFYTYSLRAETELDEVYDHFQEKIQNAATTGNSDLLRMDDPLFFKQKHTEMSENLSEIKGLLDNDRLAQVMDNLGYVQGQDISSYGGLWIDEKKLTEKSNELKKLYDVAKYEYEELTDSNEKINYWLNYVRAYAYRNVYLGVELINIVRSNSGGRTLATQKDVIDVSVQSFDVQAVTINDATVDLDAHLNKAINSFAGALRNKETRKWVKNNPKMAMGAAALTFVGGALMEKLDKHTQLVDEHREFQRKLISNIKKMTDGYEDGKVNSLRAIEIIKAIAKANKGFMAVYEPLREKYLEHGENLTMYDIQAIAKATKDYKNISDSKLNK